LGFSRGAHSLGHLSAIPDRVQGVGVARQQDTGGVAVRDLHQPAGRVVAIGGLDAVGQCETCQAPGCRVGVDRHAAVPISDRAQAARRVVRVGDHFAARVDQVRALPGGVVGVVRVPARRFNAQGAVERVVGRGDGERAARIACGEPRRTRVDCAHAPPVPVVAVARDVAQRVGRCRPLPRQVVGVDGGARDGEVGRPALPHFAGGLLPGRPGRARLRTGPARSPAPGCGRCRIHTGDGGRRCRHTLAPGVLRCHRVGEGRARRIGRIRGGIDVAG
jgi:hypothetical protein